MGSVEIEKLAIYDRDRILIPKEERERLGLRPGFKVLDPVKK